MTLGRSIALLGGACLILSVGCQPEIGDGCNSSVDCSVNGERICDTAQPGGYCTVPGCEADTCPGSSICVEFRYSSPRLSSSWCMDPCKNDGSCRESDGYKCAEASEILDDEGNSLARILDENDDRRFCAAVGDLSDS